MQLCGPWLQVCKCKVIKHVCHFGVVGLSIHVYGSIPLSPGTTIWISLRAFDFAGEMLVLVNVALLRTPVIWVRALSWTRGVRLSEYVGITILPIIV